MRHSRMVGDLADTKTNPKWRAPAILVAVVAGVFVLAVMAWLIAYDVQQRPFIMNSEYPPLVGPTSSHASST